MKIAFIPVGLLILCVLQPRATVAQATTAKVGSPTEAVVITEPATIRLEKLFKVAEVVAIVRIVSGDTENYKTALYKAVVVKNFKGTNTGQTLYYGPFIGQRLGWEYIVFLHNAKEPAVPITAPTAAYGTVNYLEVFNQGYSSMENSYECVFDGKESNNQCDYGVRVCTDYIALPKGVSAFPPESNDPPFGCRWVRKSVLLSLFDDLVEHPEFSRIQ